MGPVMSGILHVQFCCFVLFCFKEALGLLEFTTPSSRIACSTDSFRHPHLYNSGSPRPGTSSPAPPPKGCGSVLLKDSRAWDQADLGSSPSSAVYQLCSEPWLLQLQERACLSGLQYSAECEMKAGQPLECRDRCVPDPQWGQPGHPHHCCPCLCLLREGLKKCSLEKSPMSLHIPFPRLAMLFQADFSLSWVPPGLIKSLSLSVK